MSRTGTSPRRNSGWTCTAASPPSARTRTPRICWTRCWTATARRPSPFWPCWTWPCCVLPRPKPACPISPRRAASCGCSWECSTHRPWWR
ncbi:30S ribosomal protein S15, partial [Dysosmobacter welbionis]